MNYVEYARDSKEIENYGADDHDFLPATFELCVCWLYDDRIMKVARCRTAILIAIIIHIAILISPRTVRSVVARTCSKPVN
ncbi:hypothetical protein D3C73_1320930 [compost metagenome]